jgi:phytoene dehydrogenase-like protein
MTGFGEGGRPDAVVVGSGPNGLAAAITLAGEGLSVQVLEAQATFGGGCRSLELTDPRFLHDLCAAVHPLGISSPFFRSLPFADLGLEWVQPEAPAAHPLDGGTAVMLERDVARTAAGLGEDGSSYARLMEPLACQWDELVEDMLNPPVGIPRHPFLYARFGLRALRSAQGLASRFQGTRARALVAGLAAHGALPLEQAPGAAFVLSLAVAGHAVGWPLAKGGTQSIANALAAHLRSLGGELATGRPVRTVADLPEARLVLFDVTPRQLLSIGNRTLPSAYQRRLRQFRYGPGAFKVDWALKEPIPWLARECARAATVHLGGTFEEIAAGERAVWRGRHPELPYVILVQPTLFDPKRAPRGAHIAWAYCHVPNGSEFDMTDRIENQVERFAPGFRESILARSIMPPAKVEEHNWNHIGGDISGGVQDLKQTFLRPVPGLRPYAIPVKGWYLCSSSTPPGGGVHGMCGYHAARMALQDLR